MDFLWCHVGDDLVKDVGASAKLGASPVWAKIPQVEEINRKAGGIPGYSTASPKERSKLKRMELDVQKQKDPHPIMTSLSQLPDILQEIVEKKGPKV
eukprot:CAMPEP_0116854096 /NCGR_PEP_ID=MMETSP0418-20121206/18370_1 /TAXON_ID=1158023 /ORGANISM="Astrosyne radiata, Strain 13vi08-1A" /LENGTH=96 /DNA_ID=CAMNT_0004486755 /DNA_START=1 /DNA_END=287 /DNA_ORIENTATION=+